MLRVIDKADVKGKRILVRVDYNVPLNKGGSISNDERIRESLETIRYLVKKKGRVILISHLGRPDGRVVEELRLDRVAERLSRLIHMPARKIDTSIGREAEEAAASLKPGSIMMLENIRFTRARRKTTRHFHQGLQGSETSMLMMHSASPTGAMPRRLAWLGCFQAMLACNLHARWAS